MCVPQQQIRRVLCILISRRGKIWQSSDKPASETNVWSSVKWTTLYPNNLTQSSFVVRIGHCSHCTRLSCSCCLAMFHNLFKINLAYTSCVCDSSGDVSSSTLMSSIPLSLSWFLSTGCSKLLMVSDLKLKGVKLNQPQCAMPCQMMWDAGPHSSHWLLFFSKSLTCLKATVCSSMQIC